MTEAERLAELERLIEEQRKDDTHLVRHDHNVRQSMSLDAMFGNGEGGEGAFFANMIGVDEEGEVVSFLRPFKGEVLNGTAEYHGTEDGYSNHLCRCARCRRANADAAARRERARAKRIPEHVHGTANGYNNYRCRCDACSEAEAERKREYEERTNPREETTCQNPKCGKRFMPWRRGLKYCSQTCYRAVTWERNGKRRRLAKREALRAAA